MLVMRHSAVLCLTVILFGSFNLKAQEEDLMLTAMDSVIVSSWIFGLGLNVVDDAGSEFSNFFNLDDNLHIVSLPSRISAGKYFKNGVGLEIIGTYNRYKSGKTVDQIVINEDIDYYAADFRVSYDLNQILGHTGWFDPYVGIGVGYTDANNQGRGTYNAAVGFRTWLSDKWGIDINSTGKWTMNADNSSNHIQHAAGVVYQIEVERGLTRKGEEKLRRLQELEKERQRVQDSIDAARKAEEEAKRLAEELERKRLEEEKNSEEALAEAIKRKRDSIENAIRALGNVYFDLNSSYLNSNDKALLDKLTVILEENETVIIEVNSHTDSRGTDKYNLWLSERRVNRTRDYLIGKGISETRIQIEAFGEQSLVNECDNNTYCTEEKHSQNRRSEFKVIKI